MRSLSARFLFTTNSKWVCSGKTRKTQKSLFGWFLNSTASKKVVKSTCSAAPSCPQEAESHPQTTESSDTASDSSPFLFFPVTSVRHEHASASCVHHMPHTKRAACQSFTSRSHSQREGTKEGEYPRDHSAGWSPKLSKEKLLSGCVRTPPGYIQTVVHWQHSRRSHSTLVPYTLPCALLTRELCRPAAHWSRAGRRERARMCHVTSSE